MSEPTGEHFCTGCGQPHGGKQGKDPEVEIARIQAERDIRVAEIQRGNNKTEIETAAETEVAVAEIEADAAVVVAEELGDAIAGQAADEEPLAIVEGSPADPEPEPEPSMEPAEESGPPDVPAPKSSMSYWP